MDTTNTTNTQRNGRFYKGVVGTVLIILLLLTVLTASLLGVRLADYITRDDKEILLYSNLDEKLDLFSVQYANASGEITVSGAEEQKVIAPGTSVDYTFRFRNKDKIAIDYTLTPTLTYTSEYTIPILFRMISDDGEYIIGNAKEWATIEELAAVYEQTTILKGETDEYLFQWKWEFESGDDEKDTFLGSNNTEESIGVSVSFLLHAEANTDIGTNGGVRESGLGEIIILFLLLLLAIIALILMILYVLKKRKAKAE